MEGARRSADVLADGAALAAHEATLTDLRFVAEPVRVPRAAPLEMLAAQARDVFERVATGDGTPLIAAECTLAGAVVADLRRRDPGVNLLWCDAHADLNTPATSPSGLLVGMALAVALGGCLPELLGDTPPERVAIYGARTFDPAKRQAIEALGILETPSAAAVLAALPDGPVHIHIDSTSSIPPANRTPPSPSPTGRRRPPSRDCSPRSPGSELSSVSASAGMPQTTAESAPPTGRRSATW